jgi:hypothetical protein
MCTPNRFATGSLVWFRQLECCAFTGNCCADHDVQARAANELKWRTRRDGEDDYLLATLPLVTLKVAILEQLKPVALEALRTFRHVRKTIPEVLAVLRHMKRHHEAKLVLTEILRDDDQDKEDYVGPARFQSWQASDRDTGPPIWDIRRPHGGPRRLQPRKGVGDPSAANRFD